MTLETQSQEEARALAMEKDHKVLLIKAHIHPLVLIISNQIFLKTLRAKPSVLV